MGAAYGTAIIFILAIVTACGLGLSSAATGATLAYARRRGLLDQPGKRRSHSVPTPRGGGTGIVAAILLAGLPAWRMLDAGVSWWSLAMIAAALLAVASIGWRDDHAPLPVLPRLAVHTTAALLVGIVTLSASATHDAHAWWMLVPLVPVLIGFINTHNFMDGIDGILGQQGLFVMLGFGVLAIWTGAVGISALAFATAAGCLGFLVFNVPPARIFMGDVGSGTLGLTIGAVGALLIQRDPAMLWACAILPSAFLVDSGLTLVRRMFGRQRWYAPHRQHLYQWLVRINWSHARTDVAYMIWNLVMVAPLAWLAATRPECGAWLLLVAYVAGAAVWLIGKRACLVVARRSVGHEGA
jgi:UDP-N-acetylmuramyl pentapeptide phosphotransferase/UDP-N-acetylglucosamine-1-phosphate transferase